MLLLGIVAVCLILILVLLLCYRYYFCFGDVIKEKIIEGGKGLNINAELVWENWVQLRQNV